MTNPIGITIDTPFLTLFNVQCYHIDTMNDTTANQPITSTPEGRKEWQRNYNKKRWQDPEFRKRHNEIAKASAKRRWLLKKTRRFDTFPFGYEAPKNLTGRDLFMHFQSFLHEISRSDAIAAFYWREPFDPRCPDAQQRWNDLLLKVNSHIPGVNHTEKITQRANELCQ